MRAERPSYLHDQLGKLGHCFRQMGRLSTDGVGKPVTEDKKGELHVVVDPGFVEGMRKVAESIKQDLRAADQEHLFYETFRKVKGR